MMPLNQSGVALALHSKSLYYSMTAICMTIYGPSGLFF